MNKIDKIFKKKKKNNKNRFVKTNYITHKSVVTFVSSMFIKQAKLDHLKLIKRLFVFGRRDEEKKKYRTAHNNIHEK